MNFQNLLQKMRQLDETSSKECNEPTASSDTVLIGEKSVDECGGDMMPMHVPAPKQQDSVTMSVNMNGNGANGIRDLMSILKNIEQGGSADEPHGDDEIVVGMEEDGVDGGFASATTEPNPTVAGVDAVIPTGNDLASKGAEAEKVNGGGNPMGVDESLVARLAAHYESIKEAKKEKEPEGTYSSKRQETDGQRVARLAREKRQAQNKERMKNDFNAEMERE